MTDTTSAETAVIGAALTSRRSIEDVENLQPEDFYEPKLAYLWEVITRLRKDGKPHDLSSVATIAKHPGITPSYVAQVAGEAVGVTNAEWHAELVMAEAIRRRALEAAARIQQLFQEVESEDIPAAIESARAEIDNAGRLAGSAHGIRVKNYIMEYFDGLEAHVSHVPTPWPDLDFRIGGLRPGAVYVVAARPATGKSLVGIQLAIELGKYGTCLLASLEMSRDEVMARIVSQKTGVAMTNLTDSKPEPADWDKLNHSIGELDEIGVFIDDRGSISPLDVRSNARSIARAGKLSGIVIDYLQLMSSPRGDRRPRHEVVSDFSRQLKLLAKELHVPVIVLSQLNRASENREGKVPSMGDLRESGAIEQDADVIMLLHMDEGNKVDLTMGIAKNRQGQTGKVELERDGAYGRVKSKQWRPGAVR